MSQSFKDEKEHDDRDVKRFGMTLLLELTNIFIIQTQSEVVPKDLRKYLIAELAVILPSITRSDKLYLELVKEP